MLEFLLGAGGLDINATNDKGWTPLMCALMDTKTKPVLDVCRAAETLLRYGARAYFVTDEDRSPLHALGSWHLRWQRPDSGAEIGRLARKLIASGAPVDIRSGVIRSPASSAGTLCVIYGGSGCASSGDNGGDIEAGSGPGGRLYHAAHMGSKRQLD